jgi:putative transcriptional regulator
MNVSLKRFCTMLAGGLLIALAAMPAARAFEEGDITQPVLLVANPKLGEFYHGTVLIVRPVGNDQHIGFIVNRPTQITLGKLFPEHEPSKRVKDPVFLGGPDNVSMIFAVVERDGSPGGKSLPLMDHLFVAIDEKTVDEIIEHESDHARFFAGMVAWKPGELAEEIRRGLWYVMKPDADLVLRHSTAGMWDELLMRTRGAI